MNEDRDPEFQDLSLARLRDLAEETVTVAAAADAGFFGALQDGPADAAELAERLGLEPRPVRILLPVLAELGLLRPVGGVGRYALTDVARRTLADPSSPEFQAEGLPLWLRNLRAFTQLPEVLGEDRPVEEPERTAKEEEKALADFMAAMNAAPAERVRRLVDRCLDRAPDAERVLDLGGGPGHMSREFARRGLDVVLFDRPETVEYVGGAYELETAPGIRLVGGDFLDDPLPEPGFDIVLMSNILHIYSPEQNRELLRKVAGVTRAGGVCAVADFVRGASPRAARFALVMLLRTEGGNTYREEEYAAWLREAGFHDPRMVDLDADRQLVTAIR